MRILEIEVPGRVAIQKCKCGCEFRASITHTQKMSAIKYEILKDPDEDVPAPAQAKKWEW